MNIERPDWCPQSWCKPLSALHGIVCGGETAQHVRICVRGAGRPIILDKLDAQDLDGLRGILDMVQDAYIGKQERAAT